MKKLRFKNRGGILYFGLGDKFKSSKLKYTNVNKNIIISRFKSGLLNEDLELNEYNDVPTVAKLLDEVVNGKMQELKHRTMVNYIANCKNHIIPYFKDMLVSQVKPITIKNFQDFMIEKGLGKGVINTSRVILKEVFDLAIYSETVNQNPIKTVGMPSFKKQSKKAEPFTLDEIDLILKTAKGSFKNFLGISFFSGMRAGEVLGLKWENINFTTDTISVTKTVSSGIINSPKTPSSYRDIEMLPKAKEFLKAQRLETGLQKSYVFLNRNENHYFDSGNFYYLFQVTLEKIGLKRRGLHQTRHTFASLMLNNGIDSLWVSSMLGHESLDITLKIYTHYMPKKEKMSIGFLEKRYKNGTA